MEPTALSDVTPGAPLNHEEFLQALEGKLSIAITRIEVLGNGTSGMETKLDEVLRIQKDMHAGLSEVKAGQSQMINGQKQILNTLTNAVLQLKAQPATEKPLSKPARLTATFAGGMAGGIAGGALMTLILEILFSMGNPQAVALVSHFYLRRLLQSVEELVEAVGHHPAAFGFDSRKKQVRGDFHNLLFTLALLPPLDPRLVRLGVDHNRSLGVVLVVDLDVHWKVAPQMSTMTAAPRFEGTHPILMPLRMASATSVGATGTP